MLEFPCHVCRTLLSAEEEQVGQLVLCPTCSARLRVPAAAPASAVGVGSAAERSAPSPSSARTHTGSGTTNPFSGLGRSKGKRYAFNCAHCSSRLEATEADAAQSGQCPTCGNQIIIPILDRYGRLIDPRTQQVIKQAPHPVHAYAAAGDRAPAILRLKDGRQIIKCARCQGQSPISANNCKACGMPFTMEGTTMEASGASNGFCVASLVLGIIGIPVACSVILPVLAVVFGAIGYSQVSKSEGEGGGTGMAIAGLIFGCVGILFSVVYYGRGW